MRRESVSLPDPVVRLNQRITVAAAFVLLLLLLALQLVHVARATSSTWDEPHHLYDGYTIWTHADYGLNPEVPPLVKLAAAVPLLHMPLTIPASQGRGIPGDAFSGGHVFVYGNGGDRVLFPARMVCAGFTLVLALLMGLAAWEMFGAAAAVITLAFFVFDPNVLANGALVTTDVGSALTLFATIYAFYRYCKLPVWKSRAAWGWLALTGVFAGLALVTKYTGILALPMLFLLALGEGLREGFARRGGRGLFRVTARLLAACVAVSALSLVVLWSFYGFRYSARPGGEPLKPTLAQHLAQLPNPADARHLALLARGHVLPEGYLWGLADTKYIAYVSASYFFGEVYLHGKRMYFPAAILIKSTLPFLLLLPVLVYAWGARGWRPYRELLFLGVPVALYLVVAINSEMNIGMRHVLPIYAFLYVLVAGAAAFLVRRNERWLAVIGVLLVWQVATTVRVAPGYMAYANEAWGGPSQTHRYLSDANVDWGQQLKAAKRYLDQRGIKDCWFGYFPDGAIEPADYGIPCKRLPTASSLWWLHLPMQVPAAIDGPVLLSDGLLEGIEFGQGALNPYESFRHLRPTAALDYGLLVYDGHFAVPLASALVHAQHAENLLSGIPQPAAVPPSDPPAANSPAADREADQLAAAAREAEQALALAPQSVEVQMAAGDVLARQQRTAEALAHYRAALVSATTIEPALQADRAASLRHEIQSLAGK
jgi:4-amino-4-deoxy-L-arabinose transferase-like glycosyltransferase